MLAGGLAIYLGARLLARRRGKDVVRLRDGRRVRLQSSVALLDGSASNLLALEYLTTLPTPAPEELRLEARSLLQTVGARAEYGPCQSAVVTAYPRGGPEPDRAAKALTFSFRRGDSGSDWYPTQESG